MLKNMKILYSSSILQMKQSFGRATYRFCVIVQPIIYALVSFMMFKDSGQENFAAYVILGTGILSLWSSICFSSAGDIERERFMGNLEILSSVPADFRIIILGKVIGNTVLGLLSMIITYLFVLVVFRVNMEIESPLIFTISLLISLLSFMGISMVLATCFTLSRNARALMNVLEYPVFILCGVLFPIEILPLWTRPLSYILSPTWAIKLLRMSVLGIDDYRVFLYNLMVLLIITIVYFVGSVKLFNRVDRETRIKATLGVH